MTRIEAPVARLLIAAVGKTRAMEMMRSMIDDVLVRDEVSQHVGGRIEMYSNDAGGCDVHAVVELRSPSVDDEGHARDDGVYWDNHGVVARGSGLPQSLAPGAIGRPLTDLVDHPVLRDLIVETFDVDEDGVAVADVVDCMWTIDRFREMA